MKKRNRLTRNEDFRSTISAKKSASNRSFVGYVSSNCLGYLRVGISIKGRYGIAVKRNLAKRQVRMMVDELFDFNQSQDIVIIIRDDYKKKTYEENRLELTYLYQKLQHKEVSA